MKRVLLCIMDGWGISQNNPETNATILANPINIDSFKKSEK
jgi:bisphosphoglycerate-independent phosphoglycerate mutase (AlkP superfamily)